MISLFLEKFSQKKLSDYSFFTFNTTNTSNKDSFTRTRHLQNDALLGQLSRGFFHDLLNPLSALSLYTETFIKQAKCTASTEVFLEIQTELNEFIKTIKTNLQNPGHIEECSFHELCLRASQLLKFKLQEKDIQILILGDNKTTLQTSPLYVLQVLSNLISNAIDSYEKSSKESKKIISIKYETERGRLYITVTDNGIGIPKEIQKDIFTPYLTTKEGGHGIGLATVKYIIEDLLQGNISITSTEESGTTVHFDLLTDLQQHEDLHCSYRYQKSLKSPDHLQK